MSPTSLNRPIVEENIYDLSFFFFFACVWSMGAIFQNLGSSVTMGQGHQNLTSSCPCLNNIKLYKFGQNPSIHSGDRVQTSHFPII